MKDKVFVPLTERKRVLIPKIGINGSCLLTNDVLSCLKQYNKELLNFIGNCRFKLPNKSLIELYTKIDCLNKKYIGNIEECEKK